MSKKNFIIKIIDGLDGYPSIKNMIMDELDGFYGYLSIENIKILYLFHIDKNNDFL